jgi:hypothetical protein
MAKKGPNSKAEAGNAKKAAAKAEKDNKKASAAEAAEAEKWAQGAKGKNNKKEEAEAKKVCINQDANQWSKSYSLGCVGRCCC